MAKWYADVRSNAQESDILPGDNALLRRQTQGKLDAPFLPEPYRVNSRTGSQVTQVTMEAPGGQQYTRNTSQVKRHYDEAQPDQKDRGQGCQDLSSENQGKGSFLTELAQAQCDLEVSGSQHGARNHGLSGTRASHQQDRGGITRCQRGLQTS